MRHSFLGLAMLVLGHATAASAGDLFTYQVPPALLYADHNDDFTIFVQSTSVNRKLVPQTRLLLMS